MGNVLYQWDLRCLFTKLIDNPQELDWFLAHVVTPEWHFEHDAGRPLADMVSDRITLFPKYQSHIRAYATRFNETIPGPVTGSLELVELLDRKKVPIFGITNFGSEFWRGFRPHAPIFDCFQDIVVSGDEKLVKPDPAIFHLALNRFDRRPEQCLFVDDRPENIAAATALGMEGHVFETAAALEQDLITLGLL